MESNRLLFHDVGEALCVRAVKRPFDAIIDADCSVQEYVERHFHPEHGELEGTSYILEPWTALVENDVEPVGIIEYDEMAEWPLELAFDRVEEIAKPVGLERMMSADTSILSAMKIAADAPARRFVVVEEASPTGTVTYEDLFQSPGAVTLYILTHELEAAAIELCIAFGEKALDSLSPDRKSKIFENLRAKQKEIEVLDVPESPERFKRRLFSQLVRHTYFIDKATMIDKCKLLVDWSSKELKATFRHAEKVRNECAHCSSVTDLVEALPPSKLKRFVNDVQRLIESIRLVTPRT